MLNWFLTAWRSWKLWQKVVFIGVMGFVGLLVIGGISSAVGGGKNKEQAVTHATPKSTNTPTLTDSQRAAATATAAFFALEEATALARPTDTPLPSATPIPPPYELALISASCNHSTSSYNECQGFVKNISGTSLQNVEAVIEWVDGNGVPQASDDALIDYNPILAGQESPWSVIGNYNPALSRFRVRFKDLLGGTILMRDDRQH